MKTVVWAYEFFFFSLSSSSSPDCRGDFLTVFDWRGLPVQTNKRVRGRKGREFLSDGPTNTSTTSSSAAGYRVLLNGNSIIVLKNETGAMQFKMNE